MLALSDVTAVALLFTAAVTPFEVAFLEEAKSSSDGLWILNRLVDVVFFGDIFLNFFVCRHGLNQLEPPVLTARCPLA